MKQNLIPREPGYDVVRRKTFHATLASELRKQIPPLGELTADRLARHLETLFYSFHPPASRMRLGQILWPAVAKKVSRGYGKRIEDIQLKPVALNLLTQKDIAAILNGVARNTIRREIAVRMFAEAYEQGGVLTEVDVASILGLSLSTVSRYVTSYEKKTKRIVPRRGTIHDIGPSMTHKREICYRAIVQGQSVEQVARDTTHSPEAVTRYIQDYRRVFHCLGAGFSLNETAFATKLSPNLVKEYAELQNDFQLPRSDQEELS
jgi:DNA-binding CsgD family transcriptional regulator